MKLNFKKGELIEVNHVRKGKFLGKAIRDFSTTKEDDFYPIEAANKEAYKTSGFGALVNYRIGESVPCRSSLCTLSKIEGVLNNGKGEERS